MSWQLPLLNFALRHTELRTLRGLSQDDIPAARRRMDRATRFLIPRPRGVSFENTQLVDGETHSVHAIVAQTNFQNAAILLYFHGGGYFIGSPDSHKKLAAAIAKEAELSKAVLPRYRLAPENVYPAALEDALAAYMALLRSGSNPADIVLGGDSAGGGLALALLGKICTLDLPRPACLFALSPWTDMSLTAASLKTNAASEVMLPSERMSQTAAAYLDQTPASDPGPSPLNAAFDKAPPVLLQASTSEILRDDSINMAEHLKKQDVTCALELTENAPHVWPFFHNVLPEGRDSLKRIARFIGKHVNR